MVLGKKRRLSEDACSFRVSDMVEGSCLRLEDNFRLSGYVSSCPHFYPLVRIKC